MVKKATYAPQKIGLTLSGGGARGAYQAGVLRAIYQITNLKQCPFQVICGVSAGALNAMAIASRTEDFKEATQRINDTWLNLTMDKIFKTDSLTALSTALMWITDLTLGEYLPTKKVNHLLDTSPLRELLKENLNTVNIQKNIKNGHLHGVALSATDYRSGKCVTFFDGSKAIKEWDRYSGIGRRAQLSIDHMMASSAIPIFFPPVQIDQSDYGDGGIGQSSALSPVLRLGADKILAIGLEHPPGNEETESIKSLAPLTLSDITSTLFSNLFLKSMRGDVMRLKQTNRLMSFLTPEEIRSDGLAMRKVPALFITPSVDLGKIEVNQFSKFPFALRRVLKGLGFTDRRAWDLLSYLAFDSCYAKALLNLGYKDGMAREAEILEFLELV
ncbi:MAG: patatin-like phospholipase family protein [Chitinophagaceae bacterium]|nr:patatin-like phospholipase family protein [Oligoflexus sp.]